MIAFKEHMLYFLFQRKKKQMFCMKWCLMRSSWVACLSGQRSLTHVFSLCIHFNIFWPIKAVSDVKNCLFC